MKMRGIADKIKINAKNSRFHASVFINIFLYLLLMSGIHTGLIVLMNTYGWNAIMQSVIPIIYWAAVAAAVTIYIAYRVKQTYDKPLYELAKATHQVADGDFSVYVPTQHTEDKWDCLDVVITDFNKMVAELGSMETLKVDFFSNVSHEIKTPLSVIHSSAQMLTKSDLTPEQLEYAISIETATKKLGSLIMNILKLNKLEKQKIQPENERYDLSSQLCECALNFEAIWSEKDIDFEAEIDDSAYIYADKSLMEIVWNNLLSNAVKFTDNGGKITLKQEVSDGEVIVSVIDTGCGMSPETKKHIFEKFYQGDTSHSTEGNGLGLAMVYRIVQMMDLTLSVKSTQGVGSEFTVRLPIMNIDEGQG